MILVPSGLGGKRRVKKPFQGFGSFGKGAAAACCTSWHRNSSSAMFNAAIIVQAQGVAGRRRFGRCAHLLVDVGGEAVDVFRIEIAADGIALSANLHRHDLEDQAWGLSETGI